MNDLKGGNTDLQSVITKPSPILPSSPKQKNSAHDRLVVPAKNTTKLFPSVPTIPTVRLQKNISMSQTNLHTNQGSSRKLKHKQQIREQPYVPSHL